MNPSAADPTLIPVASAITPSRATAASATPVVVTSPELASGYYMLRVTYTPDVD